jgi:hypothetical protein
MVGYLNDRTRSLAAAFVFIGACYLLAASILPLVKIRSAGRDSNPVLLAEKRAGAPS